MSIIALALALATAETEIGPRPAMEDFIALAEPVLREKARDPQNITFKWPYQLVAGPAGYYTCGMVDTVRGRRPREEVWVTAVVASGRVVGTQWSTDNGMLAWDCKRNVRAGTLVAR